MWPSSRCCIRELWAKCVDLTRQEWSIAREKDLRGKWSLACNYLFSESFFAIMKIIPSSFGAYLAEGKLLSFISEVELCYLISHLFQFFLQGRTAGRNMAGARSSTYTTVPYFWSAFFGGKVEIFRPGQSNMFSVMPRVFMHSGLFRSQWRVFALLLIILLPGVLKTDFPYI